MNIYQKIVEIRKSIETFSKDGKGHNYAYVSGAQVLAKIKSKMDDLGVVLEQHLTSRSHELYKYKDRYNKDKEEFLVWGEMKMIWVNSDNPEDRSVVDWQMCGQQDDISKALGSGLTYAERYFLLKYFGVPTDDDDPDAKKKPEKTSETNTENSDIITKEQGKRLFAIGKGNTEGIKTICAKYGYTSSKDIKKSDYNKIIKEIEAIK